MQITLPANPRKKDLTLEGDLLEAATRWVKVWRAPQLLDRITFGRNPRLRSTIARWVLDAHKVELGPRFFVLRRRQEEILCHEIAHAAAVAKHGRRVAAHGTAWRALVRAAGFEPLARFNTVRRRGRQAARVSQEKRLFEHRCLVCQAVRFAERPVKRWRCLECVGSGLVLRPESFSA
jgi:predicted SprT family Zn-dependent metalloprotease